MTRASSHPSLAPHLINNHAGLDAVLQSVSGHQRLVLDTEFHIERRFHPELMLLQIGLMGESSEPPRSWAIDPLSVPLAPFAEVLDGAEWIVHGGQHDLQLMQEATGAKPAIVWDTQRMAALDGSFFPSRLGDLAQTYLGEHPSKGAALTDWSRRPLTPNQLRYALEDVDLTRRLFECLHERLDTRGRLGWARDLGRELWDQAVSPPDPDAPWHNWAVTPRLDIPTHRIMRALFAWRAEWAVQHDRPPHYLLPDGAALDLARRKPGTLDEVPPNRRLSRNFRTKYGQKLVELVNAALDETDSPPNPPTETERRTADTIELWAQLWSPSHDLAPGVLMPRSTALRIARGGLPALVGWRGDVARESIDALLQGRTRIAIRDGAAILELT
jgi:ribonuclease D